MHHPDGVRGPGERERKWVVPRAQVPFATGLLRSRLRPDPVHPGGYVASLYYDTPHWHFVEEKLSSDYLKTKVRLRWYENEDGSALGDEAFLEVKAKQGSLRTKLRLPAPISASELVSLPLTDRRLMTLVAAARAEGVRLPVPLEPAFVVHYRRRRYLDPRSGLRISLDDHIRAPRVHPVRRARPLLRPIDLAVLEVKGTGSPDPPVLRSLFDLGCRPQAVSKYVACHAELMETLPCP
ncbi:MAG: VTC domain-containing protein [Planctomycetota bacterium]|nr:VTC domain-containing protein [Planctomycetota bacterium]